MAQGKEPVSSYSNDRGELFTKLFWLKSFERAIKTVAQTASALLVSTGVLGLFDIMWYDLLSVAGLAGLVSVLTSIGSAAITGSASPSLLVKKDK